jgi:hypothetical protein
VRAHYLGDAVFGPVSSRALGLLGAAPAPKAVSLSVRRAPDRAAGLVKVTVSVTAGANPVKGGRVRVHVDGKLLKTARVTSKGKAVFTLREAKLRLGPNPVILRFLPADSAKLAQASKAFNVKVVKRRAAKLDVKRSLSRDGRELSLAVKAKALVKGYSTAGRQVQVRANGKLVGTVRTDAKGRAAFVLRSKALATGTSPVTITLKPGPKRYKATQTKSFLVGRTSWGRLELP